MQIEQKSLEQKYDKLTEAFREKEKSRLQVTHLYNKLKHQTHAATHAAGIEMAAEYDAENVIEPSHYVTSNQGRGHTGNRGPGSIGSAGSGRRQHSVNSWQQRVEGSRAGLQSTRTRISLQFKSNY